MDVGGELRRARTARHLSLAEISNRTKISPALLQAIEDNRFDRVPGGLFTRGYLRAYAREVELDPEAIVEQYRAEYGAPLLTVEGAAEEPPLDEINPLPLEDPSRDVKQTAGLIAFLLIGFLYFGFARNVTTQPNAEIQQTPTDAIDEKATPTPTTGTVETPANAQLKLEIQATGNCWVAVNVDGEDVLARLMTPGERAQFEVRQEVRMRVGNPASFAFTLNGARGRTLGKAGKAVTVEFNTQSYKTFIR